MEVIVSWYFCTDLVMYVLICVKGEKTFYLLLIFCKTHTAKTNTYEVHQQALIVIYDDQP